MEKELEQLLVGQTEQAEIISKIKGEIAELKEKGVDPKEQSKELRQKFFADLKQGQAAIENGRVKADRLGQNGDLIIADVNRDIVKRMRESSELVSMFGREQSANTDYSRRVAKGKVATYWDGTAATAGAPELVVVKMTSGKLISTPEVHEDQMADAFFDAESFLMEEVTAEVGDVSANAILAGDGDKKPMGFIKYFDKEEGVKPLADRKVDHFRVIAKADGEELVDTLRKMVIELPSAYKARAKFVMSVHAYELISKEKYTTGESVIQRDPNGGVAGRLHGYDIVVDRLLPDTAPVMFGDYQAAFAVVELPNHMTMQRNPYVKDFMVRFVIGMRLGTITKANDAVVGMFLA
ncbi:phage major capsid protein [Aeromonas jandaei]|nr:phage major capsid protein [Aeromonas jandaei]